MIARKLYSGTANFQFRRLRRVIRAIPFPQGTIFSDLIANQRCSLIWGEQLSFYVVKFASALGAAPVCAGGQAEIGTERARFVRRAELLYLMTKNMLGRLHPAR